MLAFLNGLLREAVLIPALGESVARPVSAFTLIIVVFVLSFVFVRWTGGISVASGWLVGLIWLILTIIFEVMLGVLRGLSASAMLEAYNPLAPTYWDLVLLGILLAPPMVAALSK